jgi:hypothetical protein
MQLILQILFTGSKSRRQLTPKLAMHRYLRVPNITMVVITRGINNPTRSRTTRFSTIFHRRRSYSQTMIRSTVLFFRVWTASSSNWDTKQRLAESASFVPCTTIRPSSHRTVIWCPHNSVGESGHYSILMSAYQSGLVGALL